MEKMIRWGFLGCGKVVHKKSGDAFRNVPHSTIEAIMRRDINEAKASAEHFGASRWCDSVEELLQQDIDAVYIATPPGMHFEQAMKCLEAKKPVYLEKPFARNYTEAKILTESFEAAGVPLYVGHYRRALPRFLWIREVLQSKRLGRILCLEFQLNRVFSEKEANETWLYNPVLSGGGKFYDIAPHTIDIMNFLFGNIVELESSVRNLGTGCPLENEVDIFFKTEKNISGKAKFLCTAEDKSDRLHLLCNNGTMEFSIHGKTDVIVRNIHGEIIEQYQEPDPVTVEQPMVQSVVEDLLGISVCESKARDALVTYQVIDQVLDEFYGGRSDDFWNHPERYQNV